MDLTLLLFLKTSVLDGGKRPLIECNSRCEPEMPDLGSRLRIRILFVDQEVDSHTWIFHPPLCLPWIDVRES